ncbi:MAG: lytic transglycosylase domain-containing protein [Clostridia bacterium]|nr:lytic transglycosylase domain-containing protein [Clostridia bacterium]
MKRKIKRIAVIVTVSLMMLAIGGIVLHCAYKAYLKAAYPLKYESIVSTYANEYDLPPSLIYAVIHTESHFREDAVSHAGAKGLMQLMDETYEWIQTKFPEEPEPPERIFEPEINIRCGAKVLDVLHDMFTHSDTAIAAYNAGSGTVSKWLEDTRYSADGETLMHIPFKETENYVKRVHSARERYQMLYGIE